MDPDSGVRFRIQIWIHHFKWIRIRIQNVKLLTFFYFLGPLLNPDPDPGTPWNPDPDPQHCNHMYRLSLPFLLLPVLFSYAVRKGLLVLSALLWCRPFTPLHYTVQVWWFPFLKALGISLCWFFSRLFCTYFLTVLASSFYLLSYILLFLFHVCVNVSCQILSMFRLSRPFSLLNNWEPYQNLSPLWRNYAPWRS